MEGDDKKELAKRMAQQRSKPANRKPLAAGGAVDKKSGFSFFGEEADGWNMSPKTILLFSVAYMGFVILLHIFGKITSMKSKVPEPDTGKADLWIIWLNKPQIFLKYIKEPWS